MLQLSYPYKMKLVSLPSEQKHCVNIRVSLLTPLENTVKNGVRNPWYFCGMPNASSGIAFDSFTCSWGPFPFTVLSH